MKLVSVVMAVCVVIAGCGGSDPEPAAVPVPGDVVGDIVEVAAASTPGEVAVGEPVDTTVAGVDVFEGRPTVVFVLAHWCPLCAVELDALVAAETAGELNGGVDVRVVLSGNDPTRANWPPNEWVEEAGWDGGFVLDGNDQAVDQFGVIGFPYQMVLGSDGNVVMSNAGRLPVEIGVLTDLAAVE